MSELQSTGGFISRQPSPRHLKAAGQFKVHSKEVKMFKSWVHETTTYYQALAVNTFTDQVGPRRHNPLPPAVIKGIRACAKSAQAVLGHGQR